MRTGTILLCAVLFLAVGCAELPRPATFPVTSQEQIQSAKHWQWIAKQVVQGNLTADPDMVEFLKPDSSGNRPRIFVQTSDKSLFDEAFRFYLITELINTKFKLSDTPDGPINLRWEIQIVPRDQIRIKPQGFPEMFAEAMWEFFTGLRWATRGPWVSHTELVLTTWITVGIDSPSRIVKSNSYTFYINDGDWANYQAGTDYGFSRSVAAKDESWKRRLAQQGLLSQ